MLHQSNLGTFNPKTIMNDFYKLKSTKNSGVSRVIKFSELSHPNSIRDSLPQEDFKLVKLIGNKEQNIQDILSGLHCFCGCKHQLKKILTLLMDKIYRLRQERNNFKKIVEELETKKTTTSIGINTNDFQEGGSAILREELIKLIEDSGIKSKAIQIMPIATDEVNDLMGLNRLSSITFEHEANQTNLLQQSQVAVRQQQISKLSFQNQIIDQRALKQCNNNNNNNDSRLFSLKSQCNKRSLDLGTLENYIEKLTTAKALNKYEIQRRKNSIF